MGKQKKTGVQEGKIEQDELGYAQTNGALCLSL